MSFSSGLEEVVALQAGWTIPDLKLRASMRAVIKQVGVWVEARKVA